MKEPPPEVKALYTQPFTYDGICYFFSGGEMVADMQILSRYKAFRPRGWGRMKSQFGEKAAALHDAHEAYLLELVAGHETDPQKCLELMNEAWGFNEDAAKKEPK